MPIPFGNGSCNLYWLGHSLINRHDPRNDEPLDDKLRVMIKVDHRKVKEVLRKEGGTDEGTVESA